MYNGIEIFEIIRNCKSEAELTKVGRAFGLLTRKWGQGSILLISKLYRIKEKQLSNGSAAE